MITLKTGDSCYFKTVRDGLVPCKLIKVDVVDGSKHCTLRVTRNGRTCYKAGEIIETWSRHAVPRAAVRRRKYATYILPYIVES